MNMLVWIYVCLNVISNHNRGAHEGDESAFIHSLATINSPLSNQENLHST